VAARAWKKLGDEDILYRKFSGKFGANLALTITPLS